MKTFMEEYGKVIVVAIIVVALITVALLFKTSGMESINGIWKNFMTKSELGLSVNDEKSSESQTELTGNHEGEVIKNKIIVDGTYINCQFINCTMEGGTFSDTRGKDSESIVQFQNCIVYGGMFKNDHKSFNFKVGGIEGGIFICGQDCDLFTSDSEVAIRPSENPDCEEYPLFSAHISAEYIAIGYVEKDNKNGTWGVCMGTRI